MIRAGWIALALAACGTTPSVSVRIRYEQPGVPAETQDFTGAGARVWDAAGIGWRDFDAADQDEYGLAHDECPTLIWPRAESSAPCVVTVAIKFVPGSELDQALGVAYPNIRSVVVRSELRKFDLLDVAAHEVGHVAFHKFDHIPDEETGIMHASDQYIMQPTDADLAWVADAEAGISNEAGGGAQ